ncbi:MAG: ATP synthase F1 subunit delta [Eggerthellaceae bacterium]|nr:ATP synthase F1 subunit delta [Eggerthellaceae bacterium]
MPTNRLAEKEKVQTYAAVLLKGVLAEGGQAAAMAVRDQMDQVVRIVRANPALAEALKNPAYTAAQRNELVRGTFAECDPALVDVLAVMAERGEADLLGRVCSSFEDAIQRELNVTIVDVTTAIALDDHLREIITTKTAKDLGTQVVLREHIDKSILGGIIMSANGKQIDASVLSKLEAARSVLKSSADGGEC